VIASFIFVGLLVVGTIYLFVPSISDHFAMRRSGGGFVTLIVNLVIKAAALVVISYALELSLKNALILAVGMIIWSLRFNYSITRH
jgi:Kef-type K+ transport system membrane component KefB